MVNVALKVPEQACWQNGRPTAACQEDDAKASARRDVAAKLCARLFPDQQVLQSACRSRCGGHTSGDPQECAFSFSRSTREITLQKPESHTFLWSVLFIGALLFALGRAVFHRYRSTHA